MIETTESDSEELVRRAAGGDRRAKRTLYSQHRRRLMNPTGGPDKMSPTVALPTDASAKNDSLLDEIVDEISRKLQ